MGKVFASVSMSLDGFIAPEGMDMEHADDPGYEDWMEKWMELQEWTFQQRFFRESLGLGEGGETGQDNHMIEETFRRTGVHIIGKRVFEGGERFWPEEAPFHTPVFVITRERRRPWERPGGTTFYFSNDGIEAALDRAREAAGERDIRISGGANTIAQYFNGGMVDELTLSLSPVVFGGGTALLDEVDRRSTGFQISAVLDSPMVTHITYTLGPP